MSAPEKLTLWERLFARHRKEIHARGEETWNHKWGGHGIPGSEFTRMWIEYKITDRLTGGETIEREYLN